MLLVLAWAGANTGCGARAEYAITAVHLDRAGWDTVTVQVDFSRRTALGGKYPVRPDTASVYLFGAAYDTLFAGPARGMVRIPVPDAALGSREPLLVEVCGRVAGHTICGQEMMRASPKRVHAASEIAYPLDGDVRRGSYDFRFVVERRAFDGEGWVRIEPGHVPGGYLLAYVAGTRQAAVRVPFDERRGRFNLTRHEGYTDFEFYLQSALFEEDEVQVIFDVYAGLGPHARPVARTSRAVRKKTRAERRRIIRYLAQQAVEQIIGRLVGEDEDPRIVAYIDGWSFNRFSQTYRVELEIRWRGGDFSGSEYRIEGVLEADASGTPARFRHTDAGRWAEARWAEAVQGPIMSLRPLEMELPERMVPSDVQASRGEE